MTVPIPAAFSWCSQQSSSAQPQSLLPDEEGTALVASFVSVEEGATNEVVDGLVEGDRAPVSRFVSLKSRVRSK